MKKRNIIIFLSVFLVSLLQTSCLNSYLDKAPESGLTEQDVFTKYENFKSFFDAVYKGQNSSKQNVDIQTAFSLYFSFWDQKYTWDALTDMSDMGRIMDAQTIKGGQIGSLVNKFTYDGARRPILQSMFTIIRISNMALQKIDLLQNATEEDKADFIAQAHFVRAFAHFTLFKIWGPMPYLTKVLGPADAWDIPRLTKHETLLKIAADMDTAAIYFEKAGTMRRDNPVQGGAGHLNNDNLFRPNGVAAIAMKGRALLYAASPLNNEMGKKDWEDAAKANWDAIQLAEKWGYFLYPQSDYKLNFIGTRYSDEEIWGWSAETKAYNDGNLAGLLNGVFASSKTSNSGECPTQNTVDKFETKWGDALNTAADRQAATAAGHYNEQDSYTNRDPRFYIDILYNTAPIAGYGTAKIYYEMVNGAPKYSELLDQTYSGITHTGYYQRKLLGDQSVKNKLQPLTTDPIIRLAELYLNYAEAANEAYGPNTRAPGADMSAVEAINKIRSRVGMPEVLSQYTGSTDAFRARIKNERTVELCFEGHYYFDIRRWMDAPVAMTGPIMGMDIEKVPVSATYPTGYKYTRLALPSNRQSHWKDAMYYLPFNVDDGYKMTRFAPNLYW